MDEHLRACRAAGAVISELLAAARAGAADGTSIADIRAAMSATDDDVFRAPLSVLGIDSLTWMGVLTALEEKFDVVFADAVALNPRSYTIAGLSDALADALAEHGRTRPAP